jgi:hypothetical protein
VRDCYARECYVRDKYVVPGQPPSNIGSVHMSRTNRDDFLIDKFLTFLVFGP